MTKKVNSSPRNSNIELLRVISMFMIVAYHYSILGFYADELMYSANKSFVDIFGMGGKLGVDIFVMISGYYMVRSRFTLHKLLTLMGQVWFYTIGCLVVFLAVHGLSALSASMLADSMFPLLRSHYWFASYYVLLMLLSPFINTMLLNLNKKQHAMLAALLFLLCTVLPEFLSIRFADGSLWLLLALYITAAWLRLYVEPSKTTAVKSLLAAALLLLLCAAKIFLSNRIAQQNMDEMALANSVNFLGAYSPYAFIIAILLLLGFSGLPPRHDKLAFFLGSTSFGVYLFHANQIVSERMYQNVFHCSGYAKHPLLWLHAICFVFIIYACGSVIELIRQKAFVPIWEKVIAVFLSIAAKFQKEG